jgi:hypothetical protein
MRPGGPSAGLALLVLIYNAPSYSILSSAALDLGEYLKHPGDGRRWPQIPAALLVWAQVVAVRAARDQLSRAGGCIFCRTPILTSYEPC